MAPGRRLFLAILALVLLPAVAAAQPIPSGALPGTERRQIAPPVQGPRAQPGGPAISLPSTVAPPGAESIMLTVSRIVITGATVYAEADFAPLYADLLGHEVPLGAGPHHQGAKAHSDNVICPRHKPARSRTFFDDYTARIIADGPANIRTLE